MIVGAIGNTTQLTTEQRKWLRNTLRSWLARWDVTIGYCNLEPRIGIHFAQILMNASIPFRAILPLELPQMTVEDEALLEQLKRHAVAVQKLSLWVESDPWMASRLQVVEHCDVVFAVVGGEATTDAPIKAALLQACLAQRAVITLDLSRKSYHITCKHQQW